jgi:hypothetical protein
MIAAVLWILGEDVNGNDPWNDYSDSGKDDSEQDVSVTRRRRRR